MLDLLTYSVVSPPCSGVGVELDRPKQQRPQKQRAGQNDYDFRTSRAMKRCNQLRQPYFDIWTRCDDAAEPHVTVIGRSTQQKDTSKRFMSVVGFLSHCNCRVLERNHHLTITSSAQAACSPRRGINTDKQVALDLTKVTRNARGRHASLKCFFERRAKRPHLVVAFGSVNLRDRQRLARMEHQKFDSVF